MDLTNRILFLQKYEEFYAELRRIGFIQHKNLLTKDEVHYKEYNTHINALGSVERYNHPVLKLSLRFIKDRYKHRLLIINGAHNVAGPVDLSTYLTQVKKNVKTEAKLLIKKVKTIEEKL